MKPNATATNPQGGQTPPKNLAAEPFVREQSFSPSGFLYGPVALIYTAGNTGSWRLERPVVDYEICIACGTCQRYCPADIITVDKGKAEKVVMDWEYCKGCGICANECPKKCIEMKPEGEHS